MPQRYLIFVSIQGSCMGCPSEERNYIEEFETIEHLLDYCQETSVSAVYLIEEEIDVHHLLSERKRKLLGDGFVEDYGYKDVCPHCSSSDFKTSDSKRGKHLQDHTCSDCLCCWESLKKGI